MDMVILWVFMGFCYVMGIYGMWLFCGYLMVVVILWVTGGEHRCSGVRGCCSNSGIRRGNLVTNSGTSHK
jgi:uncharacterized membrane protein